MTEGTVRGGRRWIANEFGHGIMHLKSLRPAFLAVLLSLPAWLAAAPGDDGIEALTAPSKDLLLSFHQPGQIAKIPVREGDLVKSGTLLVQLEDSAEQASLEQQKIQADDTVRVDAAQAQLDQKKLDLKNLQFALERNAATQFEVDHAVLDVTIADLSLKLAKLQHRQDELKYKEIKGQVDRMRLVSPVDGKVERIMLREGETPDQQAKVIRIVCLDPLWVDVSLPLPACSGVTVGQDAEIYYAGQDKPVIGKISFVAAVAVSDTLTVRVEVPNPQLRRAGDRVKVRFPGSENCQKAAATRASVSSKPN